MDNLNPIFSGVNKVGNAMPVFQFVFDPTIGISGAYRRLAVTDLSPKVSISGLSISGLNIQSDIQYQLGIPIPSPATGTLLLVSDSDNNTAVLKLNANDEIPVAFTQSGIYQTLDDIITHGMAIVGEDGIGNIHPLAMDVNGAAMISSTGIKISNLPPLKTDISGFLYTRNQNQYFTNQTPTGIISIGANIVSELVSIQGYSSATSGEYIWIIDENSINQGGNLINILKKGADTNFFADFEIPITGGVTCVVCSSPFIFLPIYGSQTLFTILYK